MLRKLCLATLMIFFTSANWAHAEERDYLSTLFPGCGPVRCVVKFNMGGSLLYFDLALEQMAQRHVRLIVIDGPCASSCAHLVDFAKLYGIDTCITAVGELGFHKGTIYKTNRFGDVLIDADGIGIFDHYFDPPQTPKVLRWIKKRHGFPISNTFATSLRLNASNAHGTFRICGPDDMH